MRHVSDLLRTPAGRGLTLVAGPWDARPVESVVLVDEPRELGVAPPGALAILSRHAMRGCDLLDALRLAGRGGLAGLVLPGHSGTSPDIVDVARRAGVALLAGAPGQSLSDTVLGLSAAVRADPGLLLRRTRAAIDRLGAIEGAGEEDILRAASASVGTGYGVAEIAEPGANATVIRVDGRPDGYVRWDGQDPAAAIVAQVVATTLGRVRAAARVAERARERALLALLRAATKDVLPAARRARHEGVPVDAWHIAVFLCAVGSPATTVPPETAIRRVRQAIPAALGQGDLAGPPLVASWQDGLLVVLTLDEHAPAPSVPTSDALAGPADRALTADAVARAIAVAGLPAAGIGIGTCQGGPDGLRRTASQARAAAGRAAAGQVVRFDRLGVHAILAELTGSESAIMAARDMLAPLDDLGALSAHAVPTLKAYLDSWGSRTRAAELLTLHPNAVAHRIRRIAEALGADLSDPETRLALQLACHVVLAQDCLPGTTAAAASS